MLSVPPGHGVETKRSPLSGSVASPVAHVISSAILGVGSTRRLSAVRWGIAGRIVTAWVVTIPACVGLGWAFYQALRLVTGAR